MSNEQTRILDDIAIYDEWLRFGIKDESSGGYDVPESIEHISFFLVGTTVLLGWSTVDDLRQRVHRTNNLDREAVEKLAVPAVTSTADHSEAVARRIIHHSSRHALRQVKSKSLRQTIWARSALRDSTPMPGMGRKELKDYLGYDDFAEQL